jgi:hypothetical protein
LELSGKNPKIKNKRERLKAMFLMLETLIKVGSLTMLDFLWFTHRRVYNSTGVENLESSWADGQSFWR